MRNAVLCACLTWKSNCSACIPHEDPVVMLQLLLLLVTSIVVDSAAGGCDFDHRWPYEARPCSGWSLHQDNGSGGRFTLLTGRQVSTDNFTRLLLPLVDNSEGTSTGAMTAVCILGLPCRYFRSDRTSYYTAWSNIKLLINDKNIQESLTTVQKARNSA